MPCVSPLYATYSSDINPATGKRGILFVAGERKELPSADSSIFALPCGQCWSCRLEKSRQWAIRCMHEASLYVSNCFITLTYDDEHLPAFGSLNKRDFQLFMKRLRRRFASDIGPGKRWPCLRFYHAGEYGDKFGRPHYHCCIFGFDFPDKVAQTSRNGYPVWRSGILEEIWSDRKGKRLGLCEVGSVTFESAAYVARYIMKKAKGEDAEAAAYSRVDVVTGEVRQVAPEYTTMSRKPGIGKPWFDKYGGEVYRDDSVIVRGREMRPPRYYDCQFEVIDAVGMERVRVLRRENRMPGDSLEMRAKMQAIAMARLSTRTGR